MRIPTLKMYAMKEIHTHFIKDDMSNFERKSELIMDCTPRNYMGCIQTKLFQGEYGLSPD